MENLYFSMIMQNRRIKTIQVGELKWRNFGVGVGIVQKGKTARKT